MEKTFESAKKNFDEFVSGLSQNEVLDKQAMRHVRGGDGEGGGNEPIIIPPIRSI
jgi:hypothetical protein